MGTPGRIRQAFYRLARQARYESARDNDPTGVARYDAGVNARLESRRRRLRRK